MDPTAEPTDGDSTGVETSEPEFVTPEVIAPESADPQAAAPETADPQAAAPETSDPEATAPETADPQAAAPETADPQSTATQATAPADPQAAATQAAAPETDDPQDDWPQDDWPQDDEPEDDEPEDDESDDGWFVELPIKDSLFNRHRTLFVLGSIGAAVLIGAIAFVVTAIIGPADSTLNVRVIVPAPASVGGLHRDYTDEANPQFQVGLSQFRQRYAASFTQNVSSYATAIYTNATAGQSASVGLLYLGFNSAGQTVDPASAISTSVRHIKASIPGPASTVHVSGLSGDTSAACIGSTISGSPIAICVWATDKTEAILATLTPGTDTELASVLRKIEPDLVRG